MIAPTHIAFAVALGQLAGLDPTSLKILAGSALLPDIDHPQSAIGRIFFFLSMPLNRQFGHRQVIHGFFLWGLVALAGFYWHPALLIGLGALSHVLIDCWNVSGVQALSPFSEKVCVLFGRQWRFVTGSKNELILLLVCGAVAWTGGYIGSSGGIRALMAELMGTYQMAVERYVQEGTKVCELKGKLRYPSSLTVEGQWKIIGKEGATGVAILDAGKLLHIPRDAVFLKARLVITDKTWQVLKVNGVAEAETDCYMSFKDKWIAIKPGSYVSGNIIGTNVQIKPVSLFNSQ